jgi:DNA-binding response OmpR family regulator
MTIGTESLKDGVGVDLDELEQSSNPRVLVVDDDSDTVFLLKQVLKSGGFNVMSATSGAEALTRVARDEPDLVLLDIMMPDMDGWETFSNMRKMTDVPVIIISAKSTKDEVVVGLRQGVDDYITKPFYNPEVVERVKIVLRRAGKRSELSRLVFPKLNLVLDLLSQQVILQEQEVHLTPKEFEFISLLARNTPAVVRYDMLANALWSKDTPNIRKRANYLAYLLRRKLEEAAPGITIIENVDRVGYKLHVPD